MSEVARDQEGSPFTEGAAVVAWRDGEKFAATVKAIKPPRAGDGDFRGVVLVRDDDHTEVERDSDQVVAVVGDEDGLPETIVTAVVETRSSDERAVIRLSGRAGLRPVDVDQVSADPRTQQVRDALMDVPQVSGVAVVATESNRARNIVVRWEAGADRDVVGRRAWLAVSGVLPEVQLRRAFWQ